MLTEQISSLSPVERSRLNEYIKSWEHSWLNTGGNECESVEKALSSFYQRLGRKAPFVIWCDSPWQLAVAPFLLKLICFHPSESQRRLLRRSYDRGDIYKAIRFELSRNLHLEPWARALDNLMSQLTLEMELAFAYESTLPASQPLISIERSIGLRLEKIMGEAHNDMRRNISLNIIEEVMRDLTAVSRPAMRARMTLEQQLGFHVGRRFSDFNVSIRGGFRTPVCSLVNQFIEQMGNDFAVHVARLVTENFLTLPVEEPPAWVTQVGAQTTITTSQTVDTFARLAHQQLPSVTSRQPAPSRTTERLETSAESRLTQAMTDCALTWANWSADFFRVYLFPLHTLVADVYKPEVREQLEELATLRSGAFMYIFSEQVVFACKNPLAVRLDGRQQLHADTQPAVEFLDGYSLYCWQGVPVNKEVIDHPELLTPAYIEAERNMELRRVMVERYGAAKFLMDAGAELKAEDECGTLFTKLLWGDEALTMVRVRNSTPEPDGTFKDYFLRVPPNVGTPREAVAWTFGLKPEEYQPVVQT